MISLKVSGSRLIEIGRIEQSVTDQVFADLGLLEEYARVDLRATAVHEDGLFHVTGTADGTLHLFCARCSSSFERPVSARVDLCLPETTPEIDVSEEVRQQLILGMPDLPLCAESCKGMCPQCGADKNRKDCVCRPPEIHDFADTLRSALIQPAGASPAKKANSRSEK